MAREFGLVRFSANLPPKRGSFALKLRVTAVSQPRPLAYTSVQILRTRTIAKIDVSEPANVVDGDFNLQREAGERSRKNRRETRPSGFLISSFSVHFFW